jgi:hypothetical protein
LNATLSGRKPFGRKLVLTVSFGLPYLSHPRREHNGMDADEEASRRESFKLIEHCCVLAILTVERFTPIAPETTDHVEGLTPL